MTIKEEMKTETPLFTSCWLAPSDAGKTQCVSWLFVIVSWAVHELISTFSDSAAFREILDIGLSKIFVKKKSTVILRILQSKLVKKKQLSLPSHFGQLTHFVPWATCSLVDLDSRLYSRTVACTCLHSCIACTPLKPARKSPFSPNVAHLAMYLVHKVRNCGCSGDIVFSDWQDSAKALYTDSAPTGSLLLEAVKNGLHFLSFTERPLASPDHNGSIYWCYVSIYWCIQCGSMYWYIAPKAGNCLRPLFVTNDATKAGLNGIH